jgi:hypothetical protein
MKFLILLILILSAPVIGGLYGALHDQLTYTISPEYYTRFKFLQFGLVEERAGPVQHPRLFVAIVGWMATWWVGLPVGLIIGPLALIYPRWQAMMRGGYKALLIVTATSFVIGLSGLIYGYLKLSLSPPGELSDWYLPDGLVHYRSFVSVGSMHNFSYVGGIIGLFAGIVYLVVDSSRFKKNGSVW